MHLPCSPNPRLNTLCRRTDIGPCFVNKHSLSCYRFQPTLRVSCQWIEVWSRMAVQIKQGKTHIIHHRKVVHRDMKKNGTTVREMTAKTGPLAKKSKHIDFLNNNLTRYFLFSLL